MFRARCLRVPSVPSKPLKNNDHPEGTFLGRPGPTAALHADSMAVWRDKCPHARTEVRRRISDSGRVSYWPQCLRCGRFPNGQVAKATLADPDAVPDADDTIATAYQAEQNRKIAAIDQKHVRLQKRERAERRRWYDGYLNSPAWRAKRRAVMERAGGICEGCLSRPAVHVHHLTYDHVGDELLWELVAVCDHCHARCHPDKQEHAAA
jgi:5-methylcytosine-specific restriction endonuclease McrA